MIDELDARLIELLAAEPRVGVLEASRRLRVARDVYKRQVRMSRVFPWPRSPSRIVSCPARMARSRCGSTVWPKPTIPGNRSSPARILASRFRRISSLTDENECPLARSSPSVVIAGRGDEAAAGLSLIHI